LSGINLNTADADELDSIMYVGQDDAEKIIEYRNEHGNFERVEDIKNVKGLSAIIRKSVIDNTYV
jgi:competence protein ComEA